jgi:hypothetical protein
MTQDELKDIVDREDVEARKAIRTEIEKRADSKYWRVAPAEFHIAGQDDFDHRQMARDLAPQYPHLPIEAIHSAVIQNILLLHMR